MKPQNNFEIAANTMREAGRKVAALLQTANFENKNEKTATITDIKDRIRDITAFLDWLKQPVFD